MNFLQRGNACGELTAEKEIERTIEEAIDRYNEGERKSTSIFRVNELCCGCLCWWCYADDCSTRRFNFRSTIRSGSLSHPKLVDSPLQGRAQHVPIYTVLSIADTHKR